MRREAQSLLKSGAMIPAMPLALDENRRFDEEAQRRLIRYYLSAGADGLAGCVHTTQFAIRRPELGLFEPVMRVAASEMAAFERKAGRAVLKIAGACGPTEQAVAEAALAAELGYDAVLLSPGGLHGFDEEYMLERTCRVGEVMPVIGFYLQPAVGGRAFSFGYWRRLMDIESVAAVKCAPFDRYLTLDVMRAGAECRRDVALYTGNDDSILTDLMTEYRFEYGGQTHSSRFVGGLLGHWAVWTHRAKGIFRAAKEGKLDGEWPTLAAQITDANAAFFDARNGFAGCIAGLHEVLRRQGLMRGSWCVDPDEGLSPGQAQEIDRVYGAYPHLNDDAFVAEFLKAEGVRGA